MLVFSVEEIVKEVVWVFIEIDLLCLYDVLLVIWIFEVMGDFEVFIKLVV